MTLSMSHPAARVFRVDEDVDVEQIRLRLLSQPDAQTEAAAAPAVRLRYLISR